MSECRCISRRIVQSGRFLSLPPISRCLYYQLILCADDDGVVEALPVLRMEGRRKQHLQSLIDVGLIIVLDEKLMIFYINDWHIHNTASFLRSDRKNKSIYFSLLQEHGIDVIEPKQRADRLPKEESGRPKDDNGTTMGHPKRKESNGMESNGTESNPNEEPTVYYPNDEKLDTAFKDYIAWRNDMKSPMNGKAIELAIAKLEKLSGGDNDKAIEIINQSIVNGWKGLFALTENKAVNATSNVEKWQHALEEAEKIGGAII